MKFFSALLFLLVFCATSNRALADWVAAWGGQSLCENMFTDTSVSVTPAAGTYIWNQSTLSWGGMAGAGVGAIEYAKMIKAQTGQDVYMISACKGGTALLSGSAVPAGSNNYWSSTASDSPLTYLVNQVNASGKKPNVFHFNQGQAEYTSGDPNLYGNYYNTLGWVYTYLLNQWGLTSSQMPMVEWISGRANYGNSGNVNAAQLSFAISYPGVRLGPTYQDLTYDADGTHVSGWQNVIMGDRGARSDLKALGVSGFSCSGTPRILGGWMVTNQLIEVITDSPCGLHTWPWATTLTGWNVSDASWNPVTISSAWLAGSAYGTSIYLQLAWSINPRPYVWFWKDQWQNSAALPNANDTSLGVNGNVVAPLPYGFQSPN